MRTTVGIAIVDLHDVAEPLDDHRLGLVDEHHARRRQRDEHGDQRQLRDAAGPSSVR